MATTPTTKLASAPPPGTSRLGAVKGGIIAAPKRIFIYGADGTGKTTLAADAEKPIFADIEGGSEEHDVSRYMFRDDKDGHVPRTYDDVLFMINDLTVSQHDYKTLVFDTVDSLESLLWAWMIKRDNDPSVMTRKNPLHQIEDYGFGIGFTRAVDVWRDLAVRLDRLRTTKNMQIVILAHAKILNFKNPEGENYDRWVPALDGKAAGFLKGWANIVGRLCHEEIAKKENERAKAKGFSTGARILNLAHSAAADAKGRGNLPEEIEVPRENPWSVFAAAIAAGAEQNIPKLVAQIAEETTRIGDAEMTVKVDTHVKAAVAKGDRESLITYLNALRARPAKSAESAQ